MAEILLNAFGETLYEFNNLDEYLKHYEEMYESIDIYRDYIKNVLKKLYGKNENKIEQMIESIVKIEETITRFLIYNTYMYKRYPIEKEFNIRNIYIEDSIIGLTLKQLNEKYSLINWNVYFEKRFELYNTENPLNDNSFIFISGIFDILYNDITTEFDVSDLVNYAEWQIIESVLYSGDFFNNKSFISEDLYNIRNDFEYKLRGYNSTIYPDDNIYKLCVNSVIKAMPEALNNYYLEEHFSEETELEVKEMIKNTVDSMINRFHNIEWLDDSTREHAIEKIMKTTYNIGYDYKSSFSNIYYPITLNSSYLSIKRELMNYHTESNKIKNFKNDSSNNKLEKQKIQKNILENQTIKKANKDSYIVNAFYIPEGNKMKILAGQIQSPYYDINNPDYMNYAMLGSTLGHELTHGFDDFGKRYNANGGIENWWTDNDNREYNEFLQCFIDQYSSYTFKDEFGNTYNIDGEQKLSENLADNGGLNRAYEAWKISMKRNPEKAEERNMRLPGLSDYTLDQLFYISYAHQYCNTGNEMNYINDPHSPGRFRVNGVVSNSKRFAKVFNCPANSPMNPNNKCVLW